VTWTTSGSTGKDR